MSTSSSRGIWKAVGFTIQEAPLFTLTMNNDIIIALKTLVKLKNTFKICVMDAWNPINISRTLSGYDKTCNTVIIPDRSIKKKFFFGEFFGHAGGWIWFLFSLEWNFTCGSSDELHIKLLWPNIDWRYIEKYGHYRGHRVFLFKALLT